MSAIGSNPQRFPGPAIEAKRHGHDCVHVGSGRCSHCRVRSVSVCAALEPSELEALEGLASVATFGEREVLLLQGDEATSVYNVIEGTVRLYRLLSDGRRQIVGFLLPGDFMGLSLSERYAFSADAVEPVKACRFSRTAFAGLVDEKPHFLRRLHEAATHELTLAQDHMVLLGRRTAEERVVAFLLGMRERFGRLGLSVISLRLPMTRQDMADFLGLTLETVSRTISKLAHAKSIVVTPDGVRLLDPARLEAIAGMQPSHA